MFATPNWIAASANARGEGASTGQYLDGVENWRSKVDPMSKESSRVANAMPSTASPPDVLIPNKAALWRLGASRTHLWRVVKSKSQNCPSPLDRARARVLARA